MYSVCFRVAVLCDPKANMITQFRSVIDTERNWARFEFTARDVNIPSCELVKILTRYVRTYSNNNFGPRSDIIPTWDQFLVLICTVTGTNQHQKLPMADHGQISRKFEEHFWKAHIKLSLLWSFCKFLGQTLRLMSSRTLISKIRSPGSVFLNARTSSSPCKVRAYLLEL